MRTLAALLIAASLTGCAPRYAMSHIQDYRPKGQDEKIAIQGAVKVDPALFSSDYGFMVRMDNVTRIALNLDAQGNGEISCKAGHEDNYCKAPADHAISAACIGSSRNSSVSRINCTVFVDDERAATFDF